MTQGELFETVYEDLLVFSKESGLPLDEATVRKFLGIAYAGAKKGAEIHRDATHADSGEVRKAVGHILTHGKKAARKHIDTFTRAHNTSSQKFSSSIPHYTRAVTALGLP